MDGMKGTIHFLFPVKASPDSTLETTGLKYDNTSVEDSPDPEWKILVVVVL